MEKTLFAQNTVKQITEDGSEHIINGLTDWVYEEEFGFVRKPLIGAADSNSIAFMRFDETDVPEFSMDIYDEFISISLHVQIP